LFSARLAYTARVSDDSLRIVLAAVLGPLFWGLLGYLWDKFKWLLPGAYNRAARDRSRREESLQRATGFGRQLGGWLGNRLRRLKR
jgi:hypothetical protein